MTNSVTNWLEDTARKYPDKVAFADKHKSITFSQLRSQALALAGVLVQYERKQPIAVYMDKSVDMLVAYMGIAYSGNFYSPIAVDMPAPRIQKILKILQPARIICDNAHKNDIGQDCKVCFDQGKVESFLCGKRSLRRS